jgi:hypothetical protein
MCRAACKADEEEMGSVVVLFIIIFATGKSVKIYS